MRKLAIVGYGKMGRLIEQLAPEYDFEVALKLDEFNNANGEGLTAANFAASMRRSILDSRRRARECARDREVRRQPSWWGRPAGCSTSTREGRHRG